MTNHEATEQAYKNGYEDGYKNGYEDGKPKWIPVTERLPEAKGCYLIDCNHWWDGKPVAREAYWNGDDWLSCYDKGKITPRTTHWMHLPEPPKGE